jgi:pimeloyl-ACP methyl ester carboxylesterase
MAVSVSAPGSDAHNGPVGDGWREEIVSISGGRQQLAGILTISEKSTDQDAAHQRLPVLLLHGWGSYRGGPHRMLVEMARFLGARGHDVLRFDMSGRGNSGGDYWQTDLDCMIADGLAAATFLRQRTTREAIAAVGLCSGANVALGCATLDKSFAAVVALSALPFQRQRAAAQNKTRTGRTLRELLLKALRLDTYWRLFRGEIAIGKILRRLREGEGGSAARVASGSASNSGSNSGDSQRNLKDSARDIQAQLADYQGQLLFLYGESDVEGLNGWRSVLEPFFSSSNLAVRQSIIPGADHDYHHLGAKLLAIEELADFLQTLKS